MEPRIECLSLFVTEAWTDGRYTETWKYMKVQMKYMDM